MLLNQDSGRQVVDRVAVEYGNHRLSDDRSSVERLVDEVDRAAAQSYSMLESLALRVEAGKCGKQRRMDVEDAAGKRAYESGA